MQNISESYLLEIKKPSRSFECRITIGDNIYTNSDIINITIEDVQPNDGFNIGTAVSKSLELTLSTDNVIYSTSVVKVEIGLLVGPTIEYVLMGYFNIDDIEKTDYSTKLTCYDNMMKFEKPYFSNLGETSSLQNIVNELAEITGVEFTGSLPSYNLNKLEGFTCREILGYVASLCAGNAYITREGKFTISTPKSIDYSITDENYINLKTEEDIYIIGAVTCKANETELTKGTLTSSTMEVTFENPWVNDSILTDIYNKLRGFEYVGYSMKWQGDLTLDVGDVISLTDNKGIKRNIPILSQKLSYNGGLTSEIGAKGESKNKNEFSSTGNLNNKVNRVVTELLLVNKALINKADISQLNAVSATIGTLEVKVGKIDTLINGNLTSDNIHSLILTSSKVTVENGFIKNAMIENVDVSKVNAGDISTNKFRIISDSGKMLISDNTIQIKDNNRVRVQIGKDASNDYSMYVWDSSGKLMFDATGLKADGIKNKIIRDDMISDNANINGEKLNISSVVTSINNGTTTIKGSKIYLDEKSQTLNVAFNSMSNTVNGHTSTIGSHTTSIGVMQGQINGLISDTTIVEDGTSKKIKDVYTSLKATVNGISSKVSNVESSFNNLQIGGRNLLLNTDFTSGKTNWSNSHGCLLTILSENTSEIQFKHIANKCVRLEIVSNRQHAFLNQTRTLESDTYYTVSAWVYGEVSVNINPYYNNNGWFGIGTNVSTTSEQFGKWTRLSCTFKPNKAYLETVITIGLYNKKLGDVCFVTLPQLEKGTKTTDWTPAPEDIDSSINAVDTKVLALDVTVKSTSSKVSAIEQSMESITQRVSSTETKVTTVTNTANTANSNATNALNTANSANSKIDSLEVGGRNLIINSNFSKDKTDWSDWGSPATREFVTSNNKRWCHIKGTGTANYQGISQEKYSSHKIMIEPNTKYTFSARVKGGTSNQVFTVGIHWKNGGTTIVGQHWQNFTIGTSEQVITHTFTSTNSSEVKSFNIMVGVNSATTVHDVYFTELKLEKGSKATDYSPAPEDIQTQIDANKIEISSTKSKVSSIETNLSGITQRVSTVEQNQTSVNGKVTSLETWKREAEKKITDSAIISTVSTQFYKKGETDSKYASQTQITQLSNQISSKVDANGVKSVIEQNPDSVSISFNKISDDVVTISDRGLRIWHEGKGYTRFGHEEVYQTDNSAGRKLISLTNGGFRFYRDDVNNSYLGGIRPTKVGVNMEYDAFGITIGGGNHCWYTSIGRNINVYIPSQDGLTGFEDYLNVVFSKYIDSSTGKLVKEGTHVKKGGLFLNGHNQFMNGGIIEFDDSDWDRIWKHKDGSLAIQCEKRIRLAQFASTGEEWNGIDINFPLSKITSNLEWDFGGQYLKNGLWAGSYANTKDIIDTKTINNTSTIDNLEVVNTKDNKLGIINKAEYASKVGLKENEFDYEQLIYSLVQEVKQLKEEIKKLKAM